jgi:hypothetical protein
MKLRSKVSWPPYHLLEEEIEEKARRKLDKLERIYHIGQNNVWDGRQVLSELIARHGAPQLPADQRDACLRVLSVLMWGELAAWAISADLAERITDVEAKMAATSQAHDEARHFYVMRDYCKATGEQVPRMSGISRRLLIGILETKSMLHKLVGMQLLVESNALGIFHALVDAQVEPVLTELLPYYERDEARHVGLGVLYLPRLLRDLNRWQTARLIAFQARCVGLLVAAALPMHAHFAALGVDSRAASQSVVQMQADIFSDMIKGGGGREAGGRARDAVRGLVDPSKGFGPALVDFLHPEGGRAAATPLHRATLRVLTRVAQVADRAWA